MIELWRKNYLSKQEAVFMKCIKALAAALVFAAAVPVSVCADGTAVMDYNNDGIVDIFDMVSARKGGASESELKRLSGFLLGNAPKSDVKHHWGLAIICWSANAIPRAW